MTLDSVQRRLAASPVVGEPIKPLGARTILALASSDAAFRTHVAARLSPREQSRARLVECAVAFEHALHAVARRCARPAIPTRRS